MFFGMRSRLSKAMAKVISIEEHRISRARQKGCCSSGVRLQSFWEQRHSGRVSQRNLALCHVRCAASLLAQLGEGEKRVGWLLDECAGMLGLEGEDSLEVIV